MDDAQIILTLIGIVLTGVLAIITSLILFILDKQGKKIDKVDDHVDCVDRKLVKVTTVMVMLMPEEAKKLLQEGSPLEFKPGDNVAEIEQAVKRYLDDVDLTKSR